MVARQRTLPERIMSDCAPQICGPFCDEFISLLDITLTFSMASHPQTDGIAGVTKQPTEQLLQIHIK